MSRSVTVASGRTPMGAGGTIRWAISSQEPALHLFRRSEQNRMIRVALRLAGRRWTRAFLPQRFTDYVEQKPFPYGKKPVGFLVNKARRMGMLQPIFQRLFNGWDPWSSTKPGLALIEKWKQLNPGKYRRSITGAATGLIADLRKNAKRQVREVIADLNEDGAFQPLVQSGDLRKTALKARARATATANKAQIKIAVPFPGPRNPRVGDTIRTMPRWEVAWVANQAKAALVRALHSRGVTAPTRDATGAKPGRSGA